MANEAFPECVLIKNGDKITLAFETEADASVGFDAIERLVDALSSDAVAGGKEAARIGSAVVDWMVKFDLLDSGNEYYVEDVLSVLNDLAPKEAPPETAKLQERVKELEPFAEFGHERKHVWEEDFATARRVRKGDKVDG